MTKDHVINGFEDWWGKRWNWFAILTYRIRPSLLADDGRFYEWLDEVREDDGGPDFSWVRIIDHSFDRDQIRYYVLVGGLRLGSKHYWAWRWQELAGDAFITYTLSRGGAASQLQKNLRLGGNFAIQYRLGFVPPGHGWYERIPLVH